MVKTLRLHGLTITWIIGFVSAVALSYYIAGHPGPILSELRFARWLQERSLSTAARIGNDFGYSPVSVPIGFALALLALVRRRYDLAWMFGIIFFIRRANSILKEAVAQPRPTDTQLVVTDRPEGYAYTSGHAFGSALLLGVAIVCLWRLPLPRPAQIVGTIAFLLFTIVCGMSRVYVGAHWPTDVGGAWLIAALWIGLLAKIADLIRLRFGPMDHF